MVKKLISVFNNILKESDYKVEKQKYNFTPKEDSDLSFKEAAKIINKNIKMCLNILRNINDFN